jgi:hypothetical protein
MCAGLHLVVGVYHCEEKKWFHSPERSSVSRVKNETAVR